MDEAADNLIRELKRIGVSRKELIAKAGISVGLLNRRLYRDADFTLQDISTIGAAIESLGGNPENIWPNYSIAIKNFVPKISETRKALNPSGNYIDASPSEQALRPAFGKPLYENNTSNRASKYLLVPGFDDITMWLRAYDQALMPSYNPGSMFALKEIDKDSIIYGSLYYLSINGIGTFRKLQSGKRPDSILLSPINPDYQQQEIFISDISELFIVRGVITML